MTCLVGLYRGAQCIKLGRNCTEQKNRRNNYRIVSNIDALRKSFQRWKALLIGTPKITQWSKGALIGAAPKGQSGRKSEVAN